MPSLLRVESPRWLCPDGGVAGGIGGGWTRGGIDIAEAGGIGLDGLATSGLEETSGLEIGTTSCRDEEISGLEETSGLDEGGGWLASTMGALSPGSQAWL